MVVHNFLISVGRSLFKRNFILELFIEKQFTKPFSRTHFDYIYVKAEVKDTSM